MSEWKEYKLKDICLKITDGSHKSPKAQSSGYPMFSVKDMEEYGFNYNDCKLISSEDFAEMKSTGCVPEKDDILIAKDGSYLKQIFICKESREEAILSSIAIFRPDKNIIEPRFLMYLLKSPQVFNYIKTNCVSGSAIPRIVLKSFKDVSMRVPESLTEQKRISNFLEDIDNKIITNRRICENLEAQAQALFKHWFVDFAPFLDKPSGKACKFVESELGMIPEGWRVGRAEDFYTINIGKTPPRAERQWFSESRENNKIWISISDMGGCGAFISDSKEYLTPEAQSKFNVVMVPVGTVLLSFKLTLGRVAIADAELTTNEAIARFILPSSDYREYTYLYLKQFKYGSLGSTSSIATAVNSKIIKAMPFLMPSNDIIKEFSNIAGKLFDEIKNLNQESARLSTLRDTLLPKLMSGKIKV